MSRQIVLSGAAEADIPFIVGLLKENGLPFSDVPEKREAIFLALSDVRRVGIGGVELLGEYGLLRSLAVIEGERNRGYGAAIVEGLREHAREKGVRELYLLTMTAAPFFARLGFTRIKRDRAPEPITRTSEFSSLCPNSAVPLVGRLD